MALKYKNEKWSHCEWNGAVKSIVDIPPNSKELIYNISQTKFVVLGERRYQFLSRNLIAIDVLKEDAEKLVEDGLARYPNSGELLTYEGYLSRRF